MTTTAIANDDDGFTFADFHGTVIGFRRADRYVNATALCQAARKRWTKYWANQETHEVLSEISLEVRIRTSGKPGTGPVLVEIGKGHRPTWVHPRVAWHLAQWASPELASWVTGVLDRLSLGLSINPVDQQRAVETFATKADVAELRLVVNNNAQEHRSALEALGWRVADVGEQTETQIVRALNEHADVSAQGQADVRTGVDQLLLDTATLSVRLRRVEQQNDEVVTAIRAVKKHRPEPKPQSPSDIGEKWKVALHKAKQERFDFS